MSTPERRQQLVDDILGCMRDYTYADGYFPCPEKLLAFVEDFEREILEERERGVI